MISTLIVPHLGDCGASWSVVNKAIRPCVKLGQPILAKLGDILPSGHDHADLALGRVERLGSEAFQQRGREPSSCAPT